MEGGDIYEDVESAAPSDVPTAAQEHALLELEEVRLTDAPAEPATPQPSGIQRFFGFFKWGQSTSTSVSAVEAVAVATPSTRAGRNLLARNEKLLSTIGMLLVTANDSREMSFDETAQGKIATISPGYVQALGVIDQFEGAPTFIDSLFLAVQRAHGNYLRKEDTLVAQAPADSLSSFSSAKFSSPPHGPTGEQRANDLLYTYNKLTATKDKLNLVIQYLVAGDGNQLPGSLKTKLKEAIDRTFGFNEQYKAQADAINLTDVAELLVTLELNKAPKLDNQEKDEKALGYVTI